VGWERVVLDPAGQRVLQPGGVALDLSGIANGHGVDAVVDWLRARAVPAARVEVGGELRGYGRKPDGRPWTVLAEAWPEDAEPSVAAAAEGKRHAAPPCVLVLDGDAVATSGDYWHHFTHDGRSYSHTIDPRSGAPVDEAPAAVTVVADTALAADAWATALTVLGPTQGHALAEARGIAARFVTRTGDGVRERASDAFRQRLAQ